MSGDQIVNQRINLLDTQHGCGMRVHHGGMVNVLFVFSQNGFGQQCLHVDVGFASARPDVRGVCLL